MTALAVVPALELLGQINLAPILEPLVCGVEDLDVDCQEKVLGVAAAYASFITTAGIVMRFLTNTAIKDK